MSIAALNWAFAVPLRGAEKAVLLALAWRANPEGRAWPSQIGLSLASGVSERHVRTALTSLEARGLIVSERCRGRLSAYVLQLEKPEASSGLPDPKPEVSSGFDETETGSEFLLNRKSVPVKPEVSSDKRQIDKKDKEESVRHEKRGSRLSENWEPSSADLAFAQDLGLDGQRVAASFRDYWISKPGAMATKLDWPATWRNWCRKDAARKPKARRNGFLEIIERERQAEQADHPDENPFLRLPRVH